MDTPPHGETATVVSASILSWSAIVMLAKDVTTRFAFGVPLASVSL